MYYENLKKKIITSRRTKIMATMSEKHMNLNTMRKMCQAGANCFLLNLAYVNSNDMIMQLSKYRDEIEKEFECYIPIICLLKGTLVRISMMSQPNIFLRKG